MEVFMTVGIIALLIWVFLWSINGLFLSLSDLLYFTIKRAHNEDVDDDRKFK